MKHFILHMDLDSFFVSVERVKNPELNGKPVIIGAVGRRGVVSSCSYEARKLGVHSAMAGFKAHQLCPDGIFLHGDHSSYSKYSKIVTDVISQRVPLYEKASIDEFFIDLTGMDKYYGCYDFAKSLRNEIIDSTGLPISFGLGSNKVIAKMATNHAKPNGHLFIKHGEEHKFLDPLSIKEIPSLGKKTYEFFNKRKIETIKQLRDLGPEKLEEWIGLHGKSLWRRANGEGSVKINPMRERKSISKETTFMEDKNNVDELIRILHGMAEQLSFVLRKENKKATTLAIKLKTPDFKTITRQMTIHPTNFEHEIIPEINRFFKQVYDGQKIRLIGLRLSGLSSMAFQSNLFDDNEKNQKMYDSIDDLKQRYGKDGVKRASSL